MAADAAAEQERAKEAHQVSEFIDSVRPTHLPLWAASMARDDVRCVCFSPDGTRLAMVPLDGTIVLLDSKTLAERLSEAPPR